MHIHEVKKLCEKGARWAERRAKWNLGERKQSYLHLAEQFREVENDIERIVERMNDFVLLEKALYHIDVFDGKHFRCMKIHEIRQCLQKIERQAVCTLYYLNDIEIEWREQREYAR